MVIPKTLVLAFFQCLWSSSDGAPSEHLYPHSYYQGNQADFSDASHNWSQANWNNGNQFYPTPPGFESGLANDQGPLPLLNSNPSPNSHHQLFGIGQANLAAYDPRPSSLSEFDDWYASSLIHASHPVNHQDQQVAPYQSGNSHSYLQNFDWALDNQQFSRVANDLTSPQVHEASQTMMHHTTQLDPAESSGKELDEEEDGPDLFTQECLRKMPNDIAMYFISHLMYPVSIRKGHLVQKDFIHEVISESPFKFENDHTIQMIATESFPQRGDFSNQDPDRREKRLITKLCMKNLQFLFALQSFELDGLPLIRQEMIDTLKWLHPKLDPGKTDIYDGHAGLAIKIETYYNTDYPHHASVNVKYRPSRHKDPQSPRLTVTELQAYESEISLELLEWYYKEKNLNAWERLFPGSPDDAFLTFYVRYTQKYINGEIAATRKKDHQEFFGSFTFLPWAKCSLDELQYNPEQPTIFTPGQSMYEMMKKHIKIGNIIQE